MAINTLKGTWETFREEGVTRTYAVRLRHMNGNPTVLLTHPQYLHSGSQRITHSPTQMWTLQEQSISNGEDLRIDLHMCSVSLFEIFVDSSLAGGYHSKWSPTMAGNLRQFPRNYQPCKQRSEVNVQSLKCPLWGGFYESEMVQSVKRYSKKVLRNSRVTCEELQTALVEIETTLNSRPLTYVSIEDMEEPLTPFNLMSRRRLLSIHRHLNPWSPWYRCDTLPTELWTLVGSRSSASSIYSRYMKKLY